MNQRAWIGLLHVVAATVLGAYLYSPWAAWPAFAFAVKWVAFPALALSGLSLWLLPRLRVRWTLSRR